MKKYLLSLFIVLFVVGGAFGQSEINPTNFDKKVRELKSGKSVLWEPPEPGLSSSRIIAISKKFRGEPIQRVVVEEIDFAVAVVFEYRLRSAPNEFLFTFRVKNKKPLFAASNDWTAILDSETLDFGKARYAARASEKKEFLNFTISRENLEKIAKSPNVKFRIGEAELQISSEQRRILANFLILTNPALY